MTPILKREIENLETVIGIIERSPFSSLQTISPQYRINILFGRATLLRRITMIEVSLKLNIASEDQRKGLLMVEKAKTIVQRFIPKQPATSHGAATNPSGGFPLHNPQQSSLLKE